jgi:hypothetical protein
MPPPNNTRDNPPVAVFYLWAPSTDSDNTDLERTVVLYEDGTSLATLVAISYAEDVLRNRSDVMEASGRFFQLLT